MTLTRWDVLRSIADRRGRKGRQLWLPGGARYRCDAGRCTELAGALAATPVWAGACDSKTADAPRVRTACETVNRVRAELGLTRGYESLQGYIGTLRQKLADTPEAARQDPLAETAQAMVGGALGISGGETIALLVVAFCELLSCFGVSMIGLLVRDAIAPKASEGLPQRMAAQGSSATSVEPPVRHEGRPTLTVIDGGQQREPNSSAASTTDRGPSATEEGHVGRFVADCLERCDNHRVKAVELYAAYLKWCRVTHREPVSQTRLGLALGRLGFNGIKIGVHKGRIGLRLRSERRVA